MRVSLISRTRRSGRPRRPVAYTALCLLLGLAACGDDPVRFGVVAPLETPYGESMMLGAQLAQREINDAGGIDGRELRLEILDDQADPRLAPTVADSLVNNPAVVAVVGHVNSSTMTAAAKVYARGLPAVATSATSPTISRLGEWIFRVASSDSANAVELARRAQRMETPVAILYANDDYGRGLAASFRTALLGAGGRVVAYDPYLEDTPDFRPYLERIKRRGAGLVFIAGIEEGASRIVVQARELGLNTRFLGGDGVEGLVAMGSAYDGTMVGLLFHPDATPEARRFTERFRAMHRREPNSFAALGYDATRLLAQAAAEAGARRGAIRKYLERVGAEGGHPAFLGVTGTIRFDANGDPVNKGFTVGEIRDGKILLNGEL